VSASCSSLKAPASSIPNVTSPKVAKKRPLNLSKLKHLHPASGIEQPTSQPVPNSNPAFSSDGIALPTNDQPSTISNQGLERLVIQAPDLSQHMPAQSPQSIIHSIPDQPTSASSMLISNASPPIPDPSIARQVSGVQVESGEPISGAWDYMACLDDADLFSALINFEVGDRDREVNVEPMRPYLSSFIHRPLTRRPQIPCHQDRSRTGCLDILHLKPITYLEDPQTRLICSHPTCPSLFISSVTFLQLIDPSLSSVKKKYKTDFEKAFTRPRSSSDWSSSRSWP
jgi:hypothetical protein